MYLASRSRRRYRRANRTSPQEVPTHTSSNHTPTQPRNPPHRNHDFTSNNHGHHHQHHYQDNTNNSHSVPPNYYASRPIPYQPYPEDMNVPPHLQPPQPRTQVRHERAHSTTSAYSGYQENLWRST